MSDTKHTPGPWEYKPVMYGDFNIIDKDGLATAVCVQNGFKLTEEMNCNACLIAAAPELLEALEESIVRLECAQLAFHKIQQKIIDKEHIGLEWVLSQAASITDTLISIGNVTKKARGES